MRAISLSLLLLSLCSCAIIGVRQSDLDSWNNIPVKALDSHSLFLTIPVVKTKTLDGLEIRNYINKKNIASCAGNGFGTNTSNIFANQYMEYSSFNAFQSCSSGMVGCDNIFYIRNGKVIKYKPVGNCFTNDSVRPEIGWKKL